MFKDKIVPMEKKTTNIFHLKFCNYSIFPSVGFYFFSVHSGLDPALMLSVPIKHLWIYSMAFESSDIYEWFGNTEVFLFRDSWPMGCLSNAYHRGLVESEDIFPMNVTPFQSG